MRYSKRSWVFKQTSGENLNVSIYSLLIPPNINPNKSRLFEASFFLWKEGGGFDPLPFHISERTNLISI